LIPRFAIIPTRNRSEVLSRCLAAISPQVQGVVIINNGGTIDCGLPVNIPYGTSVLYHEEQPPNLSKLWNMGLDYVENFVTNVTDVWDVVILNDDAIVPEGWFDAVSEGMRKVGAAAGCSGPASAHHTEPGPVPLWTRLQGFAFVLAGERGLRANEDIHWYFTDDYLDWESRKLGGMVMVPGFPVDHLHPNGQMTPELHAQCAKDAQTFVDIYGMRPW
jgi:glycosyltransferase involved in cell wall biosynthesis